MLVSGARTRQRTVGTVARRHDRDRLGWVFSHRIARTPLGAGAMFFRQPTLVFENRLTDMVAVQVAARSGASARWLVQLSSTAPAGSISHGKLVSRLGVSLGDTIRIVQPRGTAASWRARGRRTAPTSRRSSLMKRQAARSDSRSANARSGQCCCP